MLHYKLAFIFTSSIATKERTRVLWKFLACDFVNIEAVASLQYLENKKKKKLSLPFDKCELAEDI